MIKLYKDYCQAPIFQEFTIENEFYTSLETGHVIRTLMEEHQIILNFCRVLKERVKDIIVLTSLNEAQDIITDLKAISGHILRSEKHHIREDYTFIRRLISMAEFEPSQKIRQQHDDLGVLKRKLERTIYGVYTTPFEEFQKELRRVSLDLTKLLKKHIDIEDNILYPQAIKLIPDKKRWDKMRKESDDIGYCCFTPGIR